MPRFEVVAYDVVTASPAQPRVAALLREIAQRGHRATLWTVRDPGAWAADLDGLDVRVVGDPVRSLYLRLVPPRAHGAGPVAPAGPSRPSRPSLPRQLARRVQLALLFPDPERLWSARVARAVRRRAGPGTVVLTCSRPESAGLVGLAAKDRGAAWWLDFADGWCHLGHRAEATTPGPRRERELALERRWVRAADGVSTVNDELASWFSALREHGDVLLYPNIVPAEYLSAPRGERPVGANGRTKTVVHLGRLSLSDPSTTLEPLVAAMRGARELGCDPRSVRFAFFGSYAARDLAELERLRSVGCEVEAHAPIDRVEVAVRRAGVDGALLVLSREQRGSSSKLLDALGLDLPLFAIAPEESLAARIVGEAGIGVVAPPDAEPGDAAAAWRRFLDGVESDAFHADPAVRDRFTAGAFVPDLVDRLERLAE